MKTHRINNTAKVRLVIDGVALQTTAALLRRGAISHSLYDAWMIFEREHKATGIIGRGSQFWDVHLQRNINIQFDLY